MSPNKFLIATIALALVATQLSMAQDTQCQQNNVDTCAKPFIDAMGKCLDNTAENDAQKCYCGSDDLKSILACFEQRGCTESTNLEYSLFKYNYDDCPKGGATTPA